MKKIFYEQVGESITTDPNAWVKFEYHPFSRITRSGSTTWKIYRFMGLTPRGKIRVYESYGRSMGRARTALLIALSPGRNKPRSLEPITKEEYKKHYKPRRKTKNTNG